MRKTITLIFCITTILSFGQVKLHNENEGMLYQPCDSSYGYPNTYMCCSLPAPRYDTLSVVMLVCDTDTATYPKIFYSGTGSPKGIVYWVNGYEVSEKHYEPMKVNGKVCADCSYFYIHKEYLDENRKKLSQNIIVWQSK